MSDEKKTINVDGLSDESIEALFQKGVKDGSIATCIVTSIASACMAFYIANEDKIKDGLSKAMKFIFGKKK